MTGLKRNASARTDGRLGSPKVILWSLPAGALGALGLPIALFIPNYYVDVVGVAPPAAALVLLLLRVWDGVTDPALGVLSDRMNPPLGRRKFWVVLALPILTASIWMVFVPPAGAGPLYLGVWLGILYVGLTAMQVSHIAWGAELSVDYDDRSRFMGYYELCVILGLVALLFLAAFVETGGGEEDLAAHRGDTLRVLAVFVIGLFVVTTLPALFAVKEGRASAQHGFRFGQIVRILRSHADLRRVLLANCLYRAASAVSATLFLWYVGARLGLQPVAAAMMALYFTSAVAGMPVWIWVARFRGKRWAFVYAMAAMIALTLPFAVLDGRAPVLGGADMVVFSAFGLDFNVDQVVGVAFTALIGMTFGAAPFLARAMVADYAKNEVERTQEDHTGFLFAALTFSEKLGFAVGAGGSVALVGVIGFATGDGAEPTGGAIQRLAYLYTALPVMLLALAGYFVFRTAPREVVASGGSGAEQPQPSTSGEP